MRSTLKALDSKNGNHMFMLLIFRLIKNSHFACWIKLLISWVYLTVEITIILCYTNLSIGKELPTSKIHLFFNLMLKTCTNRKQTIHNHSLSLTIFTVAFICICLFRKIMCRTMSPKRLKYNYQNLRGMGISVKIVFGGWRDVGLLNNQNG